MTLEKFATRLRRVTDSCEPDMAYHVGLELRNGAANYLFERSYRSPGIQPNSGDWDFRVFRCGWGTQLRGIIAHAPALLRWRSADLAEPYQVDTARNNETSIRWGTFW